MLTTLGLSIICIAWLYQLYRLTSKKDESIKSIFVCFYILGVILLVIDGFMSGLTSIAWLNFVSFAAAFGVLVILLGKK